MASPQTRNLKTANGGKVAPQHYNDAMGDFEYSKGSDGALHTKVINQPSVTLVDKNGNPLDSGNKLPVDVTFPAEQAVKDTDVLAKLAEIETKIQATNDRLNQTLNTQLTGSRIEIVATASNVSINAGATVEVLNNIDVSKYAFVAFLVKRTNSHTYDVSEFIKYPDGSGLVISSKKLSTQPGNVFVSPFKPDSNKISLAITNSDSSVQTYDKVWILGYVI